MNAHDPFDRQLERGLEVLAGPEPYVDLDRVVERATSPAPRWRWPVAFRALRLAIAIGLIALFGAALFLVGAPDDGDEEATLSPPSVSYASGTLAFIGDGDPEGADDDDFTFEIAGLDASAYPYRYTVTSTDPRLDGVATVLEVYGFWDHETTVDDLDAEDPGGPWRVEYSVARIEISNDEGTWSGTVGPVFFADGSEPLDEEGGVPSLAQVGPGILEGSGGYDGLWALVDFSEHEESPVSAGPFEAIVTNREVPNAPSDALWRERTTR